MRFPGYAPACQWGRLDRFPLVCRTLLSFITIEHVVLYFYAVAFFFCWHLCRTGLSEFSVTVLFPYLAA